MLFNRVLALFLRVSSIYVKFGLFFFLAFYYSMEDVGLYGLVASLVSYSVYLLGFELHSVVNRQGIKDHAEWAALIKKQHGVTLLTSLVLCSSLLIYAFFFSGRIWLVVCAAFLCCSEYYGQEIYRRYIALGKTFEASVFLFWRNSFWPIVFVLYFLCIETQPVIDVVFYFWAGFSFAFNVVAGLHIRISVFGDSLLPKFDYVWFCESFKQSLFFLGSILIMRGVGVFDRVLIGISDSAGVLGIYVFYTSIASAAGVVLNFLGAAQSYPSLIKAISVEDWPFYSKIRRSMFLNTVGAALVVSLAIPVLLISLRAFSDNPLFDFEAHLALFLLVIVGVIFSAVNIYLHYVLYCHGEDFRILISNTYAFLISAVFLAFAWLFLGLNAIIVSVSVLVFYCSGIAIKFYFSRILERVSV